MRTTRYFDEQVMRKRPYLRLDWIEATLADPLARILQPDGRIRLWRRIMVDDAGKSYIPRVVTLEDGETVHNAFFDPHFPRGRAMKLHYYPETDSLYIELNAAPGAETREVADGVNVDLDALGNAVGIDIDHASTKLDLTTLETAGMPLRDLKAA
jgi:uncharacterized protein YuzE